jgi:hypothetical protein
MDLIQHSKLSLRSLVLSRQVVALKFHVDTSSMLTIVVFNQRVQSSSISGYTTW